MTYSCMHLQYTPALGEPVIGVIVARHAEGYRVDIGTSQSASLDALAFEDATKRNKPNLKVRVPCDRDAYTTSSKPNATCCTRRARFILSAVARIWSTR